MSLVKIETQSDFPNNDLTPGNEALLEMLMQNQELVSGLHTSAEASRPLFKLSHAAFLKIAGEQFEDTERLLAFSHGVTTYEGISVMAHPQAHPESAASIAVPVMNLQHVLFRDFMVTLTDARDQFREELPRTSHVIGASATRFCSPDTIDYALAGAAIARQLEVDARS